MEPSPRRKRKRDIYEKYRRILKMPASTQGEIDEMRKHLGLLAQNICEYVWGKGNFAVIDELFAPDFVWHYAPSGVAPDLEGYKRFQPESLTPFADMNCAIEVMVAQEDKVAIRWSWRGTHKGEYMGIAPTGKQVTLTGISILRIAGGKIAEEWTEADNLGFMEQLGAKVG